MFSSSRAFVSKYAFSTKKIVDSCRERKRILPYMKELFVQNMDNMKNLMLKSDLKFSSLVAHNYSYLNINNPQFRDLILTNVRHQLNDLTPELAYELAINLKELIEPEEFDILEHIYAFTREYFFLFSERELAGMEKVYFYLTKKSSYGFDPYFVDMLNFVKNQMKTNPQVITKRICESMGIEIPLDEIDIVMHPERRNINIKFKKLNKNLTLQGLYHQDYDSILTARDLIAKKDFDFYFMEMPPVTPFELNNSFVNKEIVINKFLDNDFLNDLGTKQTSSRSKYLSLFDRYDKLPIIDSKSLDWYVKNILSNQDKYRIKESERLVYINEGGLERPEEFSSILYQLAAAKVENVKMMFADMNIFDELNVIAKKLSLQETRELFKYGRYYHFNESIRWSLRVNKSGCPMCSKAHRDPPMDLINMIPHGKYDFSLRENFMANQIVDCITNMDEHKNFVGFFGQDHIFEMTNQICQYFTKNKTKPEEERTKLNDEELFKKLIRIDQITPTFDPSDAKLRDEHTNKFAMLSALFYNRNEFEIPKSGNVDAQLFNTLKDEYKSFLELPSFEIDKNISWKKYKQEERCFAIYTLFHDDKYKFGC